MDRLILFDAAHRAATFHAVISLISRSSENLGSARIPTSLEASLSRVSCICGSVILSIISLTDSRSRGSISSEGMADATRA